MTSKIELTAYQSSTVSSGDSFSVVWSNLIVKAKDRQRGEKEILRDFSGHANAGEFVVILGPSGAGKSTFLNCIAGKREPTFGEVSFRSNANKLCFAYVPQEDLLLEHLTVYEAIWFAALFKNDVSKIENHAVVDNLINTFKLENCAQNIISTCSGGEKRRLSLALEMVSHPNVLVLDEPTTGLDTYTAFKCIEALRGSDGNGKPAIIATVHQPSSDMLNIFDKVYVLSKGRCIYEGTPGAIPDSLCHKQARCVNFHNPCEFALRLASGGYGEAAIEANHQKYLETRQNLTDDFVQVKTGLTFRNNSFSYEYRLHCQRFLREYWARTSEITVVTFGYLFVPILIMMISSSTRKTGCFFDVLNDTRAQFENVYERDDRKEGDRQLVTVLHFQMVVCFFNSMIHAGICFPHFANVFKKEYRNHWYRVSTFFLGYITINLTLKSFAVCVGSGLQLISLQLELKPVDYVHILLFHVHNVCIADLTGTIFGVVFSKAKVVVLMLCSIVTFQSQIFSNFMIKSIYFEPLVKHLTDGCATRYVFEGVPALIFGKSECTLKNDTTVNFDQVIDFVEYYKFETGSTIDKIVDVSVKVHNALNKHN